MPAGLTVKVTGATVSVLFSTLTTAPPPAGSASDTTLNRSVPVCSTPSTNRTLTLWPGASGDAAEIALTERVELKPPPLGWAGGTWSDVPRTVVLTTLGPRGAWWTLVVTSSEVTA